VNFVEQVGYQIIIFYHLSPTNGWTNGGGKSHLPHHVEGYFEEEFENMGRMFASCCHTGHRLPPTVLIRHL
jgi:hypothetical protein